MSKLQFNPKLIICDYFDKLVNLVDIHTEEQLKKFDKSDFVGEPFKYRFRELPKCDYMGSNGIIFRFQAKNDDNEQASDDLKDAEYGTTYNLADHPKLEINPNSVKVHDYLNKTRENLISEVKRHEEHALTRYQEAKDDLLKEIQTIDDRDTQIEEFKKRLFADKHIGVIQIEKLSRWKNDFEFHEKQNESPFCLYLAVLDFYLDRDSQEFLSNTNLSVDGFLYFGARKTLKTEIGPKFNPTKTLNKVIENFINLISIF